MHAIQMSVCLKIIYSCIFWHTQPYFLQLPNGHKLFLPGEADAKHQKLFYLFFPGYTVDRLLTDYLSDRHFRKVKIVYHTFPKYSDTLIPYHTCPEL